MSHATSPCHHCSTCQVAIKALGVASATTGAFVYGVIAACDAVGIRSARARSRHD